MKKQIAKSLYQPLNLYRRYLVKKSLGIVIVGIFLLMVPITMIALSIHQNISSEAHDSTTINIVNYPKTVKKGEILSMDVQIDPGQNSISLAKIVLHYNKSHVQPTRKGITPTAAMSSILEGPSYNICSGTDCTMSITLGIGANPETAIREKTTIAHITFDVITSDSIDDTFYFDTSSEALSIGAADSPSENVIKMENKAIIAINKTPTILPSSNTKKSIIQMMIEFFHSLFK